MSSLGEARYDLVRDVGAEVDGESECHVVRTNDVAELFGAFEFVLLEPFLEELFAALLEDGTGELERFVSVEFALLEEDAEVLENGGESAGLDGDLLELLDRLRRSENALYETHVKVMSERSSPSIHRDELTLGELAAIFAASEYCPLANSWLYCCTYKSSAPGKFARLASFTANSVLLNTFKMYGIIVCSSTLTLST